jgi:hypothetical protein
MDANSRRFLMVRLRGRYAENTALAGPRFRTLALNKHEHHPSNARVVGVERSKLALLLQLRRTQRIKDTIGERLS